ncbi:MAG: hypothetical protein JSS65_10040 [Armatimonadetes bacterium]|nr:hypothetical protein [Armatimonadota bacterium]
MTNPHTGESLCAVVRREIGIQIVVDVGDRAKTFLGHVEVECFNEREHLWFDGVAIATLATFIVIRPTTSSKALPRKHHLHLLEHVLNGDLECAGEVQPVKVVAVAPRAVALESYDALDMESDLEITVSWKGDKIRLSTTLEAQTIDKDKGKVESVAIIRKMSRVSQAVWSRLTEEAALPALYVEPPPQGSRLQRAQSA